MFLGQIRPLGRLGDRRWVVRLRGTPSETDGPRRALAAATWDAGPEGLPDDRRLLEGLLGPERDARITGMALTADPP